ncbi:MAG TPA: DUF4831 family protein [Prolixibacteraceae bacterium]|nr:DUF4831 family protein [Prolixibacteraceae bacterium]HPS12495.1 DUF4831 family protein [Prolixibacteraceae bacterium]
MKIRLLVIVVFVFFAQIGWASDQKEKKNDDKAGNTLNVNDGVVYALPRTVFLIHVRLVKESYIPGPYAPYAEKYLGYSNVSTVASDRWKIVGIQVQSSGEADPGAVFKTIGAEASLVSLLPDGTIAGLNAQSVSEDAKEIVGSEFIDHSEIPFIVFPDQSSDDQYDTEVNTETGDEKFKLKTGDVKAREAADYLYKLRKKRAFTTLNPSDGVPEDGKGYEVFVQQVEKLEREYVSLFLGKNFRSEHEYAFSYAPGNENVKNEVLFRFSDEKGILPKTDISGKPVSIEMVKDQKQTSSIESITASTQPNSSRSGLYYRIPVNSSITISEGINTLYSGRAAVAQFGLILPLPENLIKEDCSVYFDPVTGSVKNILNRK